MPQLDYNDQVALSMGLQCYTREFDIDSQVALGNIPVGYGMVYGDVSEGTCRLPTTTKSTLLFDADFVTSNTIDMDINGVSIAQVTFTTDHDTTAGLVQAAMTAITGVTAVLDTTDANNRTFIVTSDEDAAVVITSVVVAAGASQAGHTITTNTNDKYLGIAVQTHAKEQTDAGLVQYVENDVVGALVNGCIVGWVEEAVTEKDSVYLRFEANGAGKVVGYFRTDADTNKAMLLSGVQFESRTSGAGLVKIKNNLPA